MEYRLLTVYEARTNDEYELCWFQGDSVKDLAHQLGVSDSVVYRALRNGKTLVKGYRISSVELEYFADENDFGYVGEY